MLTVAFMALAPATGALADLTQSNVIKGPQYMPIYDPLHIPDALTGASSSQAGQLLYGGGLIEKNEMEYFCYWGWTSDPSGEQAYLEAFTNNVGGSAWAAIQNQYYSNAQGNIQNPTGILKGTWSDSSSVPKHVTQSAVNNEGIKCMQHFGYNSDANYWVITPTGHSQSGFGTQWCAYHEALSSGGNVVAVTYFPYITDAGASCGKNFVNSGSAGLLDGVSIVGGHEGREAQNDPNPCTGWCTSGGSEGMDLCAWASNSGDITLGGRSYAVQPVYSNSAGGCVMS
jgi:serine protease